MAVAMKILNGMKMYLACAKKTFLTELNTSDFEAARREDLKRVCVFYFLDGGSFNTKQFVPFGQLNLHTDVNYFDQVRTAKI